VYLAEETNLNTKYFKSCLRKQTAFFVPHPALSKGEGETCFFKVLSFGEDLGEANISTLYDILPITRLLHINCLLRIFVPLMEKGGGIRPCDALATCTYKVLHSTRRAKGFLER
jgi:hypothetical protein